MTGTKLYQKKSQVYFFLIMYGILSAAGGVIAALSVMREQNLSSAAGFMIIFGVGMFILTLVKSRKPQVVVYDDFFELNQSRTKQIIRYRNISSVSPPQGNRMTMTLREDKTSKDVVIWLKELDRAEADRLYQFLLQRKGKGK